MHGVSLSSLKAEFFAKSGKTDSDNFAGQPGFGKSRIRRMRTHNEWKIGSLNRNAVPRGGFFIAGFPNMKDWLAAVTVRANNPARWGIWYARKLL
jgi:hypothetical protein